VQHLPRHRSGSEVLQEKETMKYEFSELTNDQLSALIDSWIRDKRIREIMKCRFLECMTFSEIADRFNICERHVKRIVYKNGDFLLSKI
jgi:DNA-directed RNA polymerase specialized sigma subunit